MPKQNRLIRCRCTLADGQRCEMWVLATGTCAAMCELLAARGDIRHISARVATLEAVQ